MSFKRLTIEDLSQINALNEEIHWTRFLLKRDLLASTARSLQTKLRDLCRKRIDIIAGDSL